MSDRGTRTERGPWPGKLLPDRASLISYLEYALEELAELDATSAALVKMAIVNLRNSNPKVTALKYTQKLS